MKNVFLLTFMTFLTACHSQSAKTTDIKIEKKTYTYKTVNEVPIKADLYRATDGRGLRPCIIWIHGGGLIFGGRDALRWRGGETINRRSPQQDVTGLATSDL